ncbi:hypothetical protein BC332_31806 [Capsicum chinense]|nr:hypothetical protein BC332_31806 [Capsicum chinense]
MKGQVIELDLLCSGLQGKFHSNSSLFHLSSLKRFDLSNNDFSGSLISTKFGELSSLTSLYLEYSGLTGVIPAEISHLSKFQVLSILTIDPYGLRLGPYNFEPLLGCIPKGKKFDTLEKSSYQGNDGLRGFPLSKDCGGDDGVPQAITPVELDDDEEEDSPMISWQAFLMGYSCGFISVLSIIYIMLSTQTPAWFSRMVDQLEYKIITRMQRHKKRY